MTALPEAGGIYLVVAGLPQPASLQVRSGRIFKLAAGYYGYADHHYLRLTTTDYSGFNSRPARKAGPNSGPMP